MKTPISWFFGLTAMAVGVLLGMQVKGSLGIPSGSERAGGRTPAPNSNR